MRQRHARTLALATAVAVGAAALTGCGPAPWTNPAGSPTPSATETVAPPVSNDLSGGSTERELTAGAVAASVNYWSELSMDRWTANAVKPISLSLVTTVTPDDGQKVYLQKATMVAVPANATETFDALPPQTDSATVNPGYLVLDPYSYSQTFNVGTVPAEATYVTVQFTYDFLVQTAPKSKEYAKQTATDTLTVAIAAG
ncbi:hypothetical protein [Microbacterium terricola]|uniref:Uncharacterized protein n=1 Tax=Microbacterium terricola TaxID=344163 RepID=A0ABM8DVV9_9MICO|nr:hypothetical protein [Microbacterium terricola]UYK39515.1 hypothetical protein OAU46_12520 [Microbacterium terricola]BDV29752.1 hypothetical protein Microterr_04120 [Microbacterium terricola]